MQAHQSGFQSNLRLRAKLLPSSSNKFAFPCLGLVLPHSPAMFRSAFSTFMPSTPLHLHNNVIVINLKQCTENSCDNTAPPSVQTSSLLVHISSLPTLLKPIPSFLESTPSACQSTSPPPSLCPICQTKDSSCNQLNTR